MSCVFPNMNHQLLNLRRATVITADNDGTDNTTKWFNLPVTYQVAWGHFNASIGIPTEAPAHIESMNDGGPIPLPEEFDSSTGFYVGVVQHHNLPNSMTSSYVPMGAAQSSSNSPPRLPQPNVAQPTTVPSGNDSEPTPTASLRTQSHPTPVNTRMVQDVTAPTPRPILSPPSPPPSNHEAKILLKNRTSFVANRASDHCYRWWKSFTDAPKKQQEDYCRQYWASNEEAWEDIKFASKQWLNFDQTRMERKFRKALTDEPVLHLAEGDVVMTPEMLKDRDETIANQTAKKVLELNGFWQADTRKGWQESKEEKKRRVDRAAGIPSAQQETGPSKRRKTSVQQPMTPQNPTRPVMRPAPFGPPTPPPSQSQRGASSSQLTPLLPGSFSGSDIGTEELADDEEDDDFTTAMNHGFDQVRGAASGSGTQEGQTAVGKEESEAESARAQQGVQIEESTERLVQRLEREDNDLSSLFED